MKNKTLPSIATILIILLWTYGGFSKLFTYQDFRFELLGHKLLAPHAFLVAWLTPSIELVIALMLMIKTTNRAGLFASAVLLSLFTVYIVYMFKFYPERPCSCGGFISLLGWKQHIVFNLFFLVLSLMALKAGRREHSPPMQKAAFT